MALVPRELLRPLRPLGEMKGDADALTIDFFAAWADRLTPTLADKCTKWGNFFMEAHGKATLGQIFKLKTAKALEALDAVGLDHGWLETLEEEAGFTFPDPNVPASAALCPAHPPSRGSKMLAVAKAARQIEPTISQELNQAGTLHDQPLPPQCYDVVEVADPQTTTLLPSDVSAIVRVIRRHYYKGFGRGNLGMPLCRHHGKQLGRAFPLLPAHGHTKGCDRRWFSILNNGQENGTHVLASPSNPALHAAARA